MERIEETTDRESQECAKKKRRSNENVTIEYLKEKNEKGMEMRKEELEV